MDPKLFFLFFISIKSDSSLEFFEFAKILNLDISGIEIYPLLVFPHLTISQFDSRKERVVGDLNFKISQYILYLKLIVSFKNFYSNHNHREKKGEIYTL